jgi:hypothetical protein
MIFYLLTVNIIDATKERIEAHPHDPMARWDDARDGRSTETGSGRGYGLKPCRA